MTRRRVMVVSHEASRTGAPRVAVQVLEALHSPEVECLAMVRWPGPLMSDFAATGARVRLEPLRRVRVVLRRFRRTRRLAVPVEQLAAYLALRRWRPEAVYLNTVKSASYVRAALRLDVPVILHIHEGLTALLASTLDRYRFDSSDLQEMKLVACSESVRATFAEMVGVAIERIHVVYSVRDADEVRRLAMTQSWDRPGTQLLVGTVGTADETKGVDRWIALAARVAAVAPDLDVGWVWVGEQAPEVRAMLGASGAADRVWFVGAMANPYPVLASLDVFTITSRFDAFPLAVIEAMILRRPVVGFDVGGVGEQVGDTGMLVPDGDIETMADAVVLLLRDEALRLQLGARAAERAQELFNIELFRDQVRAVLAFALQERSDFPEAS